MLSRTRVKIRWREDKRRWEVYHYWPDRKAPYGFMSWDTPQGYYPFTKENEHWARALKTFIEAKLVPNEQGFVTYHPDQIKTGAKRSSKFFEKYITTWLSEYDELLKRDKISKEYVRHLRQYAVDFWIPQLGNLHILDINKMVLKDFWLWLCDQRSPKTVQPLSDNTIKKVMDGLKKALADFYEDEPIKLPKFPAYGKNIVTAEPVYLEVHEQAAVIERIPTIHNPIAIFIAKEGVRMGEARALMWDCVDLEKGEAHIKRAFSVSKLGPTKTRTERRIELAEESIEAIRSIPRALKHDFVFHWQGRVYGHNRLWRVIREGLNKAGYPHIKPNQFGRHSVASQWTMAGAPTRAVQRHLGHSDIRTTARYSHVKPRRWGK